jgi:hypothetical protein
MATGGALRIFSNDLDAPAKEIADLHKRRRQIELFFRVMKQTLKITLFIGRSENAVRIQIAVALLQFTKVDRVGHRVLLSLPEGIVREGIEAIRGYPHGGYPSVVAPPSACRVMNAALPLTPSSIDPAAPVICDYC